MHGEGSESEAELRSSSVSLCQALRYARRSRCPAHAEEPCQGTYAMWGWRHRPGSRSLARPHWPASSVTLGRSLYLSLCPQRQSSFRPSSRMPKALRGTDKGRERGDNTASRTRSQTRPLFRNIRVNSGSGISVPSVSHSENPVGLRGALSARQCCVCGGAGWKQAAGREHPALSPREAVGVCITQARPVRRTQWLPAPSSVPRGAPRAWQGARRGATPMSALRVRGESDGQMGGHQERRQEAESLPDP